MVPLKGGLTPGAPTCVKDGPRRFPLGGARQTLIGRSARRDQT
jgi:hypothetical protein